MFVILLSATKGFFNQVDLAFLFEKEENAEQCKTRVEKEKAKALSEGKPYCLHADDYQKINRL